jgi:hypothetical protein
LVIGCDRVLHEGSAGSLHLVSVERAGDADQGQLPRKYGDDLAPMDLGFLDRPPERGIPVLGAVDPDDDLSRCHAAGSSLVVARGA